MPRALIVGASSGMGAALARLLARKGYALALVARRKNLLTAVSAEINKSSGSTRALAYAHDVHAYAEVPALLRIVAEVGRPRSGDLRPGVNFLPGSKYDFGWRSPDAEVNLVGAFAWLNPVGDVPGRGAGHIVGISSVAGDRGVATRL
jgi:short-subunit dehydrogenase